MTVQDLIDELKRHDPHLPVLIDEHEIDYVRRVSLPWKGKSCVQLLTYHPMNNPRMKQTNPQVA